MQSSLMELANCVSTTARGYRVYFVQRQRVVIILLCGGDKSTQKTDIRKALAMPKEI